MRRSLTRRSSLSKMSKQTIISYTWRDPDGVPSSIGGSKLAPRKLRTENERMDYHSWFMNIALIVAKRSTCARRAVGAVIVDSENRILSTGYNGVPSGVKHCTDSPCSGAHAKSGSGLDACQALHAEQNAIARLTDVRHAHTLYCTTSPCMMCTKLIAATPVQRIVALESYPVSGEEFWKNAIGREWVSLEHDD